MQWFLQWLCKKYDVTLHYLSIIIPFNLLLKPNLKGFQIKFYANIVAIEKGQYFLRYQRPYAEKISLESNHPKKQAIKYKFQINPAEYE